MSKKHKKHKGPKPKIHRPDGDWIRPAKGKRLNVVINSEVLRVHLEKRSVSDAEKRSQYTVTVGDEIHILNVELIRSNSGVTLETTATEAMKEKVGNSQIRKPVAQKFPYASRCVLELYDKDNNLLSYREAERVCRAIRAAEIEPILVSIAGGEIETHFLYEGKKYISYSDLYFNPKREFACIYLDNETFAELAILCLSEKALKEIETRWKKKVERPTSTEQALIESILACKTRQYITIKDVDWNDLVAGEAEYVAQILRDGTERVIHESNLSDEFGSVQKLVLCGDRLCYIGAEPGFNPKEMFCFDCVDEKNGEHFTMLVR